VRVGVVVVVALEVPSNFAGWIADHLHTSTPTSTRPQPTKVPDVNRKPQAANRNPNATPKPKTPPKTPNATKQQQQQQQRKLSYGVQQKVLCTKRFRVDYGHTNTRRRCVGWLIGCCVQWLTGSDTVSFSVLCLFVGWPHTSIDG